MPGGSLDYVLVSARDGRVVDLVGIELQTLDTTGTVWPARQRFLASVGAGRTGEDDTGRRGYGMNWKMTAKTILMQLHHKVRTFEAIEKKLVLVIQDHLLRYFRRNFDFSHIADVRQLDSMHFHAYRMGIDVRGRYELQLDTRASTNAEGVATCLGLRAETDVGIEKITRQLEDRLSERTLFRVDS